MSDLWSKSTKVSAKSQLLAKKILHINTDEAMIAGLIHAIGTMPILIQAEQDGLLADEKALDAVIDNLYPKLGAAILKNWEFPEKFIDVAAFH